MTKNRLLIFAHDAGSANVTMSYAYLNKDKYSSVLAFPKGPALNIYKEHIHEYIFTNDFDFLHTDTVVTGTSGIHSNYELEIIQKAKKAKVKKIITILDSISNFNLRFTINHKLLEEEKLPDEIWTDERNFQSNIEYFNQKIFYKKNIYEQYLKSMFQENPPQLQNKNIVKYNEKYIVILTEYISELYGNKFGFNEFDFLENILYCTDKIDPAIPLFIKLHPAEKSNKYDDILLKYKHLNIIKEDFNIHELIYYSKIVFGMSSSVFKESKLLKKPTYSIQIGSILEMETYIDKEFHIYTIKNLLELIWHKSCYSS